MIKIPENFRIFAHRGASGHEPENTILSIEKAVAMGAEWIEIDIQYADGEIFVFHDYSLERLTNGEGNLKDKTKNYLRSLDAGKGSRIPFLREVFDSIENKANLNIEIKDEEAVLPLVKLIDKYLISNRFQPENFIISSYIPAHIKIFRLENGAVPAAIITDEPDYELIELSLSFNCRSLHINNSAVTEEYVKKCHDKNIRVYVFTVNTLQRMEELVSIGVDGVFTDFPELKLTMPESGI